MGQGIPLLHPPQPQMLCKVLQLLELILSLPVCRPPALEIVPQMLLSQRSAPKPEPQLHLHVLPISRRAVPWSIKMLHTPESCRLTLTRSQQQACKQLL